MKLQGSLLIQLIVLIYLLNVSFNLKTKFLNSISKQVKLENEKQDSQKYKLTITNDSDNELTIRVESDNFPFLEMPHRDPFPHTKYSELTDKKYIIKVNDKNSLGFKVIRKETGENIIDTSNCKMIYNKNQIAFCNKLPSEYLFGLGSRRSKFLYSFPKEFYKYPREQEESQESDYKEIIEEKYQKILTQDQFEQKEDNEKLKQNFEKIYTIWPRDAQDQIDYGFGGSQTHGHHPVYMNREKSNKFNIVLIRNNYPIEFRLRKVKQDNAEEKESEFVVDFLLKNGPLELKIFLGDSPQEVISQYHKYLNGYMIPQFWTMGYHQSRYGYMSIDEISQKLNFYRQNHIPIDVFWVDIDHMNSFKSFTFDQNLFNQKQISKVCKKYKVKWVPIQDDFIEISQNYLPFELGDKLDIFYKERSSGTYIRGCGYCGQNVFPSYMTNRSYQYVEAILTDYFQNTMDDIKYLGGIWLDLNEPANFREISREDSNANMNCWTHPPQEFNQDRLINMMSMKIDKNLNSVQQQIPIIESELMPKLQNQRFEFKTIRLDAYSELDGSLFNEGNLKNIEYISHMDSHILNNFMQVYYFSENMKVFFNEKVEKQIFILTRANSIGQGRFSQHWLGDTGSTEEHLDLSTSQLFQSGLFGMPLTGDDVCGFMRVATPDLCNRWTQLGSLYPFMRNHNLKESPDQDPMAFQNYKKQFDGIRKSIQFRYVIAKWYYSVIVRSKGIGMVFKPLWHNYPLIDNAYYVENHFLIGDELLFINNPNNLLVLNVFNPTGKSLFDLQTGNQYNQVKFDINTQVDSEILGFLIEDHSINMQPYNELIINTYSLKNQFVIYSAVSFVKQNQYKSSGQMMSIQDYHSDVYQQCITVNDCIIKYTIFVQTNDNLNVTQIIIQVQKSNSNTIIEQNYITGFRIYGLNPNQFIQVNLQNKFLVQEGTHSLI